MPIQCTTRIALVTALAAAAGCAGAGGPGTTTAPHAAPSLVLAAPGAGGGPLAVEHGRNDARLNVGRPMAVQDVAWMEIRTVDRTRTSNGRPREFSTTTTHTLRRRGN